jgi:hypothetical protein
MPNPSYIPVIKSATSGNFSVGQSLSVAGSALGDVHPVQHGLVAWTYDPIMALTGTVLINGTMYMSAVYPSSNATISKLYWHVATVGVTPVAGQNFVGLYDSSGNLLTSANVDGVITGTGPQATAVSPVSVVAGQSYWIAWVFNAATAPGMPRTNNINGATDLDNIGLTATNARFCTNGTGRTALPASITTSNNVNNLTYWGGIGA